MAIEFQAWPKTPRLFRDIVITEKVDGTNSAVIIQEWPDRAEASPERLALINRDGVLYEVAAQSRKRLITPGKTTDNFGFAKFVQENAEKLFDLLGPGRHFGEWWGSGIQGRYDTKKLTGKGLRGFALFNVEKHDGLHEWFHDDPNYDVLVEAMPILYRGPFSEQVIRDTLKELKDNGSLVAPFNKAEGIVVFHTQSRQVYKYTIDNDDASKGNN